MYTECGPRFTGGFWRSALHEAAVASHQHEAGRALLNIAIKQPSWKTAGRK